jgi:hypothetical protein
VSKWIVAICLIGLVAASTFADQGRDGIEYFLFVDPAKPGVSIISVDRKTDARKVIVTGASSIDEAIREAMISTGKPLMLKFGPEAI